MKLRNKKTGGLADLFVTEYFIRVRTDAGWHDYNSLAELNLEWEDYEEPKEYWYIDDDGGISDTTFLENDEYDQRRLALGNYFNTRKEAEKAVEKLKAWKRLKDKGFRFACYIRRSDWAELPEVKALENFIDVTAYLPKDEIKEMEADLDLLFSGGEE